MKPITIKIEKAKTSSDIENWYQATHTEGKRVTIGFGSTFALALRDVLERLKYFKN